MEQQEATAKSATSGDDKGFEEFLDGLSYEELLEEAVREATRMCILIHKDTLEELAHL